MCSATFNPLASKTVQFTWVIGWKAGQFPVSEAVPEGSFGALWKCPGKLLPPTVCHLSTFKSKIYMNVRTWGKNLCCNKVINITSIGSVFNIIVLCNINS